MKFYFMGGSDLIPTLISWDNGQELIDEVNFIVFERKGYESVLDETVEKDYQLPKCMEVLKANQNLIGMISSTEVRKRIKAAKIEAEAQILNQEEDEEESKCDQIKEQKIKSTSAVKSSRYFYQIGGLVTKSTIEYIRDKNLYW